VSEKFTVLDISKIFNTGVYLLCRCKSSTHLGVRFLYKKYEREFLEKIKYLIKSICW
jgi:hypothetical protein